jgi:hypothetical protein
MLKDYKRRYVLNEADLPPPESRLLRVNKDDWCCPPCGGESMPYPHRARTMQNHLAANSHKRAVGGLWVAFVRHMRTVFGSRCPDVPDFPEGLDDTIPRKPRDDGN